MSTVVITGSASLGVLCISGNLIGDYGMTFISKELQYNNNVLIGLEVMRCGLSVKGAYCGFVAKPLI